MRSAYRLALLTCFVGISGSAIGQVLFEDDFDDNSAGWVLESLTGNLGLPGSSDAVFGYDYSVAGIPEAPNSGVGDSATSGMRLRTNVAGVGTDQAAVYLEDASFAGKYSLQADVWLNWVPDPNDIGTTLHGGLYVGDALPGTENAVTPAQKGAGLFMSTDGDCSNCDFVLTKNEFEMDTFSGQYTVKDFGFGNQSGFDNLDVNANAANGDLIDIPALFPSFNIDAATGGAQSINPSDTLQAAGTVGFQWLTVTVDVDPTALGNGPGSDLGLATFSVENAATGESFVVGTVDNSQPDILDDDMDGDLCDTGPDSEDICVNSVDPEAGDTPVGLEGRISLFLIDFFSGSAANTNLGFALFDNIKVTAASEALAGDYNDDGTVDAADYTVWRDGRPLANETASPGVIDAADYDAWSSNYGATASAAAAVPEPSTALLISCALARFAATRRR